MNKKVSTLLTVALTLGGSLLSSSAFAENIQVSKAEESATYKLEAAKYHNGTSWVDQGALSRFVVLNEDGTFSLGSESAATLFTVTKTTTAYGDAYSFTSVVGDKSFSVSVDDKKYSSFSIVEDADITRLDFKVGGTSYYVGHAEAASEEVVANTMIAETEATQGDGFQLVEVEAGDVTDENLNKLFNKKGFNFAVKPDVKDAKVEGNLFDAESLIWAYKVDADFKISEEGANGKDLIIPAGIYFFSDRVLVEGKDEVESDADIDWANSTLIAVSPSETVEVTREERKDAQGFTLVNVKGSEFVFENNTSDYTIGHTPITNACFTVSDNHKTNANYPYQVSVKKFFYHADVKDTNTKTLTPAENVKLGSLTFTDKETEALATVKASSKASEYIFKFSDSKVLDGKSLLKTTKEAAVYNIKFVDGLSKDKALFGKYLTNGVATVNGAAENKPTTKFVWVAKGSDIVNLNHPSFQYTITKVEQEEGDKYVNVTFTNRETNEGFTLNLFPEEGTNRYSVAIKDADATTTGIQEDLVIQPVKVDRNGYKVIVDATTPTSTVNEDLIIELIPATVDEYAGFLNVEDGSIRTIRFARDKYDTSSQWFMGVDNNAINDDTFVKDAYDAAQFLLDKEDKANTIARTFVYNNESTETVDDVLNGDKVSAYQYSLKYVKDGSVTSSFLKDVGVAALGTGTNIQKFYIKENADGSVSLFETSDVLGANSASELRVASAGKNASVDAEIVEENNKVVAKYLKYETSPAKENRGAIYAYLQGDTELKTYLESEVANPSWKAENGHVTFQNVTTGLAGNFVSMNDAREGVLVNAAGDALYLHVADKNAVVPSFFISKGIGEGNALSERMFMFNPVDSVEYQVNKPYDPNYQLAEDATKVIFKAGSLNASADTMATVIKNENRNIAMVADDEGTWAGLNRFKFQLIETEDGDGSYLIRQVNGSDNGTTVYVASNNEKLYLTTKDEFAMAVNIEEVEAPTSNEGVSATEVKVVAQDGAVVVKNAAGKNVVVSTILGQVVANEVLTSDNATINVPAGIVVVAVEGESFKVNVK